MLRVSRFTAVKNGPPGFLAFFGYFAALEINIFCGLCMPRLSPFINCQQRRKYYYFEAKRVHMLLIGLSKPFELCRTDAAVL